VLSISPPPPERLYRIDYKSAAKALQIYYKARHCKLAELSNFVSPSKAGGLPKSKLSAIRIGIGIEVEKCDADSDTNPDSSGIA
jgi:hypothetical protein